MPVIAIREVLVGELDNWNSEETSEVALCQKRINLEDGYRYQVKNVQVFDEKGGVISSVEGQSLGVGQLTYVTPYPLVLIDQPYGIDTDSLAGLTKNGPFAGDNSVLFKQLELSFNADTTIMQNNLQFEQVFPDPGLEQLTAQYWYTPHLYLSLIQQWVGIAVDNTIAKSFYIELKKTKCSRLESTIGQYKEMLEAQARLQTLTANMIEPTGSAAGRSFPSWLFGGSKAEIMINSTNVLRYFNRVASRDYQEMMTQDAFRVRYKQASNMAPFNEPQGTGNPFNIPNWITIMNVAGITSGPIRSYPPPVKYTGNGNTVMYDTNGLPASIVT